MKTDALFYELFQAAPQTFFELMQITPPCPYRFESITVKTSEKRIDGILEPTATGEPIYFLEVQAFPDKTIYWRAMREVATYFEQRPDLIDSRWQAVVLWLDKGDDPGLKTLKLLGRKPKPCLVASDLLALLQKLDKQALARSVLHPLLAASEAEVTQNVVQWVETIRQTPNLDAGTEEKLISVMSQLIEQKFRTLTYKELSRMLQLTPLAETISGQELIQEQLTDVLIRQIRRKFTIAEDLAEVVSRELEKLDVDNLKQLFDDIFDIDTFEQLEQWIADHLPEENLATDDTISAVGRNN